MSKYKERLAKFQNQIKSIIPNDVYKVNINGKDSTMKGKDLISFAIANSEQFINNEIDFLLEKKVESKIEDKKLDNKKNTTNE